MAYKLNDDASASMVILFFVMIVLPVFLWIGSGYLVDLLIHQQTMMISASLPISQDRINTTNFLLLGFRGLLVVGITLPAIVYSIVVSRRQEASMVY